MIHRANQHFNCPVLGGVALVTIESRTFPLGDEGTAQIQGRPGVADCQQKHQCGIARPVANGVIYDWPSCAAVRMINTKGSL